MTAPATARALAAVAARRTGQRPAGLRAPIPPRYVPAELATIVLEAVAELYELSVQDLVSPGRDPDIVEARRIACQLLFERDCGASAIGRLIARDHATVMHSLRRLETQLSQPEWCALQLARRQVRSRLQASAPELAVATGGMGALR